MVRGLLSLSIKFLEEGLALSGQLVDIWGEMNGSKHSLCTFKNNP